MINTPIQGNGWDCGKILLMHIYHILKCKGIDILYDQNSCAMFQNYIKYRFSKTDNEEKSYEKISSNLDMTSSMSNSIIKQAHSIQNKSGTKSKIIAE